MDEEQMYQGLLDEGYTEKQISKYFEDGLTEEKYYQLMEAKAEKISVGKEGVSFKYVNHSERAIKFGRLSDNKNIAAYLNIALAYFGHRCALSGEEFIAFSKEERPKNRSLKTNMSAEHVVALCQGGDDVYPNLVPAVYQYNLQKNGYYLLDWWKKQKSSDVNNPQSLYSPYRLLKLVNYMMKSLDARKQGLSVKQYEQAILTPNEIDIFLSIVEEEDRQEPNNSKRRIISDNITTTEVDEDGKRILQAIPEVEGNIPRLNQQIEKTDDRMMDIFLYDAIQTLKEDKEIRKHAEYEQLVKCLDEMYFSARGVIPFEVWVRNKVLQKLEEIGVKENKFSVANSLLQETKALEIAKEDPNELDNYLSKYFDETTKHLTEELELTDEQIQTAIANIPEILNDDDVIEKIRFYKQYRADHLNEYLEGKNDSADNLIDTLIKLQNIGVDISQLTKRDTSGTLAEKSGVSRTQIEEAGLDPDENIGYTKNYIAERYRGYNDFKPLSLNHLAEFEKLGISLESTKGKAVQMFIEKIKILQSIGVDTKKLFCTDSIGMLAEKSGVSTSQIQAVGLNPDDMIGHTRYSIVTSYRASQESDVRKGVKATTPPTEEQVKELKELGIVLDRIDKVQEFIEKLELLQSIGVDISKLSGKDTIEKLAKKSGVSVNQIEEIGLDLKEKIGQKKVDLYKANRGYGTNKPPTPLQLEKLKSLGISLEKIDRDSTLELIEVLKVLKKSGIDVKNISFNTSIYELIQGNVDETTILAQLKDISTKIDGKWNIGKKLEYQKSHHREELMKRFNEAIENGIYFTEDEIHSLIDNVDVKQEFISKIRILNRIGVDTSKLVRRDTIGTLAQKSNVSISQIEEEGLDPNDNIGTSKFYIAKTIRVRGTIEPQMVEYIAELKKLGISLESEEKDTTQELVEILKLLKKSGISIEGLMFKSKIKDFIQGLPEENRIVQELQEISTEIDEKWPIGSRLGMQKKDHLDKLKEEIEKAISEGTQFTEKEIHVLLDKDRGKDTTRSEEVLAFMKRIVYEQKEEGKLREGPIIGITIKTKIDYTERGAVTELA